MKKLALAQRIKIMLIMLLGISGVSLAVIWLLILNRTIPVMPYALLAGVGVLLLAAVFLGIRSYINRPYEEFRQLYQRFADGQAYEELFEHDTRIVPEWDRVLNKFRHLLNKQDAIQMSKKQAEYLALQNQINPHFLYNTLEAIRGDAICAGMDSIAETTEALSVFFRYSITGVDQLVTLEEEIDNVENYFKIQYYRFGDKLKIRLNCEEADDVYQLELPKLTIQPFVENAIFHGLEKRVQGGSIEVRIETTGQKLLITVSDDGVGMAEEAVEAINNYLDRVAVGHVGESSKKRGGIAMKNVNSRIKLLFGEEYGIHVYSTVNIGTDVKIILPKIRKGEYEKRTAAH